MIDITLKVLILKDANTVFNYLSDFRNDKFWRKEVNETQLNTKEMQLNAIITEDSFLSKKVPHYISVLTCTELTPNQLIVCETVPETKFKAKSTRQTIALPNKNQTKVIYRLQFELAIVKFGLGFALPKFIVQWYSLQIMKQYLAKLKGNLER